jgi:sialate O-acetylesterase
MPQPPSDSACRSDFPAIYKESAECGVITNMKILFRALAILFAGTSLSPGGQAIYISNEDLVARAQLIAEIEVVNVEKIDVNRKVGVARVYVSTAKVRKVFKGRQPDNTIPILSSTYPNSSAVWPRMKEGRYLAFLVQEQAHYRFGLLWAMREIDAKQSVSWHEGKAGKDLKFIRIMDNPNAHMVSAADLGSGVHPINKWGYGNRAAQVALSKVYGKDLLAHGPRYKSHTIEGNRIEIRFSEVGIGLTTAQGKPLTGFAIAGADQKFVWAEAVIVGDSVVVSSEAVAKPVAVRFACSKKRNWANLFNKDGLPALAFRTDDW